LMQASVSFGIGGTQHWRYEIPYIAFPPGKEFMRYPDPRRTV
jgi:hypothetical protein